MTQGAGRRFPIRYSIQRWDDGKWLYGGLLVILMVLIAALLVQRKSIVSFIPVTVLDAGMLIALRILRSISYVEISDDALLVRYALRHLDLPYTALSRVRRQPLEVAFQPAERRRLVNRFVRRLARQPAAYIRLDRRKDNLVEEAERRLGPRFVVGADVVIPILDVDEFVTEMKGRLRGPGG